MKNKVEHRTRAGLEYTMKLAERVAAADDGRDDAELPALLRELADQAVRESRTRDAIRLRRAALLIEGSLRG